MAAKTYIALPDDKEKLAEIIHAHVMREEALMNYRRLRWFLGHAYLVLGARRFKLFDPLTGGLRWDYFDEEGKFEYQSQRLQSILAKNTGRLEAMDLAPMISKEGWTLAAMRERAMGQAIADSIVSSQQIDGGVKKQFSHILATLGACGICGHLEDHPTIGLASDLEVVHPRELYPFPSLGQDYSKVCGMVRQHSVSLDWVKEQYGKSNVTPETLNKMFVFKRRPGESINDETLNQGIGEDVRFMGLPSSPTIKEESLVCRINETWVQGLRGTVTRYCVTSGHHTLYDEKLDGQEVYPETHMARFMENGSFHGIGLFDLLFSSVREHERLLKSVYNNTRDFDKYGAVVLPQGQMNAGPMMKETGKGLKILFWAPDQLEASFNPFVITPHNAGDAPGKVSMLAANEIEQINPLRDLIEEKGRVDSALGLQILDEKINQAMNNATSSIQACFGGVYRELVRKAAKSMVDSQRAIPVSRLTLDLVGANIDFMAGTVSFANNPLPNISRLHFGVREANPRSKVARKQEAITLLQQGATDPGRLLLLGLVEGLDLAIFSEPEKAAVESITMDILALYGDGITPGRIRVAAFSSRPDIQSLLLEAFMSGPYLKQASFEVRKAFKEFRDAHLEFNGMMLPDAVPTPEDAAIFGQLPAGQPQSQEMMANA